MRVLVGLLGVYTLVMAKSVLEMRMCMAPRLTHKVDFLDFYD